MAEGEGGNDGGYNQLGGVHAERSGPRPSGGSGFNVDTRYPRSIEGILRIVTVVGCETFGYLITSANVLLAS